MKKEKMQNIIQLQTPVLLNKLYIPIVNKRTGRPSIVKSKEAKEYTKYVHMECLRQKIKPLKGKLSFSMDILIKDRKDFDIDAVQKLLFDSLEGIVYKNDRDIVEMIARKHTDVEKDGLNILIKEIG